jgi:acetyltransferase-like isoleucine patch superfamily enzyme
MAYLCAEKIQGMGFKLLGENVLISDKASIYNASEIEIGSDSRIDDFCLLSGRIVMGSNVHIAAYCNLAGGEKGIFVEDFVGLAYGCHIFSQSDDYSGRTLTHPTVPNEYKNESKKPVQIGRHSILGTNSIIFPGVTIAEGTATGAAAVVTKSTDEWSIYYGNPAKKIKGRKKDLLALEQAYLSSK